METVVKSGLLEYRLQAGEGGVWILYGDILRFSIHCRCNVPGPGRADCLEFVDDSGCWTEGNPLSHLYLVYQWILSVIDMAVVAAATYIR